MAHSLRVKLIVVFLLLALGLSAIFVFGMQRALSVGWRLAVVPLVTDYVDRLAAEIGSPPSIDRARALTQRLPLSVRIDGPTVNWRSQADSDERADRRDDRRWHDEAPHLLTRMTADGHRITLGLGELPWERQPRLVGSATLAGLLLVIALAYAYVRRLLRPLDDIRLGVQRFGGGTFSPAIAVRRHDELGELARQINTMAHDLEQMLDGKRALLLAISHELRSPLTRARLNAELLPETPDAAPSRAALLRDLGEMRDLINDLLESERLTGNHVALQREATDVGALVRQVVDAVGAVPPIRLQLEPDLPPLALDRTRVRLALRNLVENAVRHGAGSAHGAGVAVSAGRTPAGLAVTVRDHGPGVDPQHLARLGDAFYRTDAARQRVTGGVGLGLHLARLVATAHGGTLALRNADPGLEAVLTLPWTP